MKCEECLLKDNEVIRKKLKRGLLYQVVLGIGLLAAITVVAIYEVRAMGLGTADAMLGVASTIPFAIVSALVFVFLPAGWNAVGSVIRNVRGDSGSVVLMHPLLLFTIGYLWLLLKIFSAIIVGLVVGPYQLWKDVKEIKYIEATESSVRQGLI
jgi:hypothetical protein